MSVSGKLIDEGTSTIEKLNEYRERNVLYLQD